MKAAEDVPERLGVEYMSYGVGDWFAVPLRGGGFAVGLVARASPRGIVLGYFFGPKRDEAPQVTELEELNPADAAMVRKFGDLGLRRRQWPIIGRSERWDPQDWPMPRFMRYEELSGRTYRATYDDNDPSLLLREERLLPGEDSRGPRDGLLGAGAAEKELTAILGSTPSAAG